LPATDRTTYLITPIARVVACAPTNALVAISTWRRKFETVTVMQGSFYALYG
jgi:hypothetical protein